MERKPLLFDENQRWAINEFRKTGRNLAPFLNLRYSILKVEQSVTKEMILPFLRLIERVFFIRSYELDKRKR